MTTLILVCCGFINHPTIYYQVITPVLDLIIKKWNNLKAYFGSQARKASIKNSKSGQATSDNFNYWPHFERLSFLKDVFEQTHTVDNLMESEEENYVSDDQVPYEERIPDNISDINPTTNASTRKTMGTTRKRLNKDNMSGFTSMLPEQESFPSGRTAVNATQNTKRQRTNRDEVIATTLSVVSNTLNNINNNRNPPINNRAIAYGSYIGQVLQSFSEHLQRDTINKINKIIYDAENDNTF